MQKDPKFTKNSPTVLDEITSLEEILEIVREKGDSKTIESRIRQIAEGVFDDPTQFLDENPSLQDQLSILMEIVLPDRERVIDPLSEIEEINRRISQISRSMPTGSGCESPSPSRSSC